MRGLPEVRGVWIRLFSPAKSVPDTRTRRNPWTIPRTLRASVGPVLDLQAGHLAEVLPIAGHQRRLVRQGDAGDKQVSLADLLQALGLPQPVERGGCGVIERYNRKQGQVLDCLDQTLLGQEEPGTVLGLDNRIAPPTERLDLRDDGDRGILPRRLKPFQEPLLTVLVEGECVRVQQDYCPGSRPWSTLYDPSSVIGRPRCL